MAYASPPPPSRQQLTQLVVIGEAKPNDMALLGEGYGGIGAAEDITDVPFGLTASLLEGDGLGEQQPFWRREREHLGESVLNA